jgi:anaerobic magnesium-protoporphyrin IX monomethyl ester cyclase
MKLLLIAYDNESYISVFPLGLSYVASMCRNAGHEVTIYNQDVYHWPESHLRNYLGKEKFDAVGIGACGGYYQYRKVANIAKVINESKNRPYFILGGHIASPEPEFFLKKMAADVVVIGEGEITVTEILDYLAGKRALSSVKGIAYLENDKLVRTPERQLIENIDNIPFPAWDLFPMDHYTLWREPRIKPNDRCIPVLSGRGCIFNCNFCYRMDKGFRPRSAKSIIEEVESLKQYYGITYVSFFDELLMSSTERTIELCEQFIKAKLGIRWYCNGRLNFARPDVLKIMKEAGCVHISYGIESLDEKALIAMKKALTVKQIVSGIENTLAAGISPGFNIIFGNIGETAHSLDLGVEFLLKYNDNAELRTIRPVTPYPGSPLYYYAIEKGLLSGVEDFYDNKHLNSDLLAVNFTDLDEDEFHRILFEANKKLIERYFSDHKDRMLETARKIYLEHDASFRGFRQT